MKIIVKKEFDGKNYVGSCENLPSCYAQASSSEQLIVELRKAIELYRKSLVSRNQPLPNSFDMPVIDRKIRFHTISSEQLSSILLKTNYHLEYRDDKSFLFKNNGFPFNRIHIPAVTQLSPMIMSKLFGKENVIFINKDKLSMNSSA
jgi:predicted RNase H-like HicB family nuclease